MELYEGPDGRRCQTLSEAFDIIMATKAASGDSSDARAALSVMQRLFLDAASTKQSAVVSAGTVLEEEQRHGTQAGTDELDPASVSRDNDHNRRLVGTATIRLSGK